MLNPANYPIEFSDNFKKNVFEFSNTFSDNSNTYQLYIKAGEAGNSNLIISLDCQKLFPDEKKIFSTDLIQNFSVESYDFFYKNILGTTLDHFLEKKIVDTNFLIKGEKE